MAMNPKKIQEEESDLPQWQAILSGLKKVEPLAATAKKLREIDIPKYEEELQRDSGKHRNAIGKSEDAASKVSDLRSTLRQLDSLKLVATDVSRMVSEVKDLARDVQSLERPLESSGSARTADDVQLEIGKLGQEMYVCEATQIL